MPRVLGLVMGTFFPTTAMAAFLALAPGGALLAAPAPDSRPVGTQTIIVAPDETGENAGAPDSPDAPSTPDSSGVEMPIPVVEYDLATLPAPVRAMRDKIIAAAATGDPEALRAVITANGSVPDLGPEEVDDPIAFLKSQSGDPGGREILAILIEVLDAGFVHADAGTPDDAYIWPYFARYPVDKLSPPQLVELFKLVYAGDYEDMLAYGLYTSFRVGIAPDGTWRFFLTD